MSSSSSNYKRTMVVYGIVSLIFIVAVLIFSFILKDSDLLFKVFFGYLGISAIFIPYLLILNGINKSTLRLLKKNSRIVQAEIVSVETISSTRYVAKCVYRDNNRAYTFYSETLTSNPIKDSHLAKVLVYVDKKNASNYYVDMDSIYRY